MTKQQRMIRAFLRETFGPDRDPGLRWGMLRFSLFQKEQIEESP